MEENITISYAYSDDDFINSTVSVGVEYKTNKIYIKGVPDSFLYLFTWNLVRGIISLKTKGIDIRRYKESNTRHTLKWNE